MGDTFYLWPKDDSNYGKKKKKKKKNLIKNKKLIKKKKKKPPSPMHALSHTNLYYSESLP
jgi:hypothetical protein